MATLYNIYADDILSGKVVLICAKHLPNKERCARIKGHDGICRSWLEPEEEARMPSRYA